MRIKYFLTLWLAVGLLSSSALYGMKMSESGKMLKISTIECGQAAKNILDSDKQDIEPDQKDIETYNNPTCQRLLIKETRDQVDAVLDKLQKKVKSQISVIHPKKPQPPISEVPKEEVQIIPPVVKPSPVVKPTDKDTKPEEVKPEEQGPEEVSPAQTPGLLTFEQLTAPLKAGTKTNITKAEFDKVSKLFIDTYSKEDQKGFYAAKRIIPAGSKIALRADIHGSEAMFKSIKDLAKKGYLHEKNSFKVKDKDFYIILLGDVVDRGKNSVETLYTAMRLRIENPDKVEIIRGNHEDSSVNNYGFADEFKAKYGVDSTEELDPIYNTLPHVLFLGTKNDTFTNYVMLPHGGIEPRYNPHNLLGKKDLKYSEKMGAIDIAWLNKDLQKELNMIQNYLTDYGTISPGFNNNDFYIKENNTVKKEGLRGNAINFGDISTKQYLDSCKKDDYVVNFIIRGHQHNNGKLIGPLLTLMIDNNGLYGLWEKSIPGLKQWDGKQKELNIPQYSVWTLIVSPGVFTRERPEAKTTGEKTVHNFETYVILQTAKEFKDWKLLPTKIDM